MDPLQLILRWLHVGPAIVLVGGTFFMLFVLHPATSVLPDDHRANLRAAILKRWKMMVHLGVLLFLISGFYNYLFVMAPQHQKDGLYHALMGVKMLLAVGVFFIAELLVGRTKLAEKLRQQLPKFLAINLALAVTVVMISGFLKTRGTPLKTGDGKSAAKADSSTATGSKSDSPVK